jgi:hypothetical protein
MSLPHLPEVPRERRSTATIIAFGVFGAVVLLALVLGLRGLLAPAGSPPGTTSTTAAPPSPAQPSQGGSGTGAGADGASSVPSPSTTPGAADLVQFSSPTGNIRCVLSSAGARCDIAKKDWSPGAKPPSCTMDWGNGLYVDTKGSGVQCASDAVNGGSALSYGRTMTRGDFTCASSKAGISCRDTASGHEFTLARATYTLG